MRLKRLRRDEKGASALEFALAAPAMMMFIVGVGQLGMLCMADAGLSTAVAEGARAAAVYRTPALEDEALDAIIVARIDEAADTAHEEEVAGRKAGPARRDASGDPGLADQLAGLVARAGVSAGGAKPYLLDVGVRRKCGLETGGNALVDHAFADEHLPPARLLRLERHRLGGSPAERRGAARILGIALLGGVRRGGEQPRERERGSEAVRGHAESV